MEIYEPFADMYKTSPSGSNIKLEIRNLSGRMFHLLYDIGYYSHNIRWETLNIIQDSYLDINEPDEDILNSLLETADFDVHVKNNQIKIPPLFLETYCQVIKKVSKEEYFGLVAPRLFYSLLKSGTGCFMPMDVSKRLRILPLLTLSHRSIDCGIIRKLFFSAYRHKTLQTDSPDCIDRYLAGVDIGKQNL